MIVAVEVIAVRVPDELRAAIEQRAEAERRSFSNQVRVLLEDALVAGANREDRLIRSFVEAFDAREVSP